MQGFHLKYLVKNIYHIYETEAKVKITTKRWVSFSNFIVVFQLPSLWQYCDRQFKISDGQMKQFGELLKAKTSFRSKLWGNKTVRQLDTKSCTYKVHMMSI